MKRTLLSQSALTFATMLANQGLQIAAGIVVSRVYGPAGKGAVTYAGIAILGVIAIADGLGSAVARQCGNDGVQMPAAYRAALRIIVAVSALGAVPLVLAGWLVEAQQALLYVGIAFPFALYLQTMSSFYLIEHRVSVTNVASLLTNAGAALLMLVLTLLYHPPIAVILAIWSGGYIAGAAVIAVGLRRLRTRVDRLAVQESLAFQRRFASRSSAAALLTFLAARIDVFIVAATLSAGALGNYTLALACGELMWQIGRSLAWSTFGRVASGTLDNAAALTARITRIVITVEAATALAAIVAGPAVIAFVYGPAFADAGPVLRILAVGMALYAADAILSYFLSVRHGRAGVILRIEFATLVVCAVGSLATVTRFGILGPAVATTLAYCVSFTAKAILFARASGYRYSSLFVIRLADLRPPLVNAESIVA